MGKALPLLPEAARARLIKLYEPYGVTKGDIDKLIALDATCDIPFDGETEIELEDINTEPEISATRYFEQILDNGRRKPKIVANW